MKAAVVYEPGAAPVCDEFPEPKVDDAHALVDLVGAGIHQVVRSRVAGRHYSSAGVWPAVPGVDAVARTADGQLVYTGFVEAPWGTMAERLAVPGQFGVPLPAGADPLAVAAGTNPGMASWLPLGMRRDQRGEAGLGTVLILGATGMSGGLAVDNAFALGAESVVARAFAGRADVLGVDRSADRVARARAAAPAAWFTVADLRRLPLAPASVDAVVSFFAMIHVPLAELPATLVGIVNRLRPGGFLSLALGTACSAFGADPPPSGVTCAPAAQVVALLETTGLGDVRGATASWSDADGWLEVVYVDAMRVRE